MKQVPSSQGDGCMVIPCPKCGNTDCEMMGDGRIVRSHPHRVTWCYTCHKPDCNFKQTGEFSTEREMLDDLDKPF